MGAKQLFASLHTQSQQHNGAPGHILAQEGTGIATDHQHRLHLFKLLHMDPAAAGHIGLYKDLTVPHTIAHSVAGVAVNDDLAAVHRVAHCVLAVAKHLHLATI